jgi:hypothetical protein
MRRRVIDDGEADYPALLALMQPLKRSRQVSYAWRCLTEPLLKVFDSLAHVALLRLRQPTNCQYPLRQLKFMARACILQELPSALAAASTLESVSFEADILSDVAAPVVAALKSVPTLRAVDLQHLPPDAGCELLQSRSDWHSITLPRHARNTSTLSTLIAQNRVDFELSCFSTAEPAFIQRWLCNSHLTALRYDSQLPDSCFDALRDCKSLTRLV